MIAYLFEFLLIQPIANVFVVLYYYTNSFLVSLLLLTIGFKIFLYPLYKKQIISAQKMKEAQPRIVAIREKFKKDQLKQQEEISKLYKEIGYKPLGCITTFVVQFPFLIAVYNVINKISSGDQIYIYNKVRAFLNLSSDFRINLVSWGIDFGESVKNIWDNGIRGGGAFPYVLIFVLVILAQSVVSYISFLQSSSDKKEDGKKKEIEKKKTSEEDDPMANMMGMMGGNQKQFFMFNTLIMAFFLGTVAWRVSAGLNLYWIFQSILLLLQQVLIRKLYIKEKPINSNKNKKEINKLNKKSNGSVNSKSNK
ncbi:MAG TPA: YidC/Oxa1 family membrane protein insertase [Candidatus Dojkabacteria bacterium]|nr:YidC/Oxa1 family membrane protein insertase [Candidatus Dojkabacteria bacterium]